MPVFGLEQWMFQVCLLIFPKTGREEPFSQIYDMIESGNFPGRKKVCFMKLRD